MRLAKGVNAFLWMINLCLGAGIAVFVLQNFFLSEPPDYLGVIDWWKGNLARSTGPVGPNLVAFRDLANPIVPPVITGPIETGPTALKNVELKGIMPSGESERAVVLLDIIRGGQRISPTAVFNEPVTYEGAVVPEMQGWLLVEVDGIEKCATFQSGDKRETLRFKESDSNLPITSSKPFPSMGVFPGGEGPFNPEEFTSRPIQQQANREVWEIDPREADWAVQNWETILQQDVTISVYPSGGLQVARLNPSSLPQLRGLREQDVIRSVNGRALSNIGDLRSMMDDQNMRNSRHVTIVVQRAGKNMTFTYRLSDRQ